MAKLDEHDHNIKKRTKKEAVDTPKSDLRGRGLVYIDNDDDITSIVSKIKDSEDAVVALVPPKRVGVLQSVVNLKLLQRAARTAKKQLVIVTVDSALNHLAAGLEIPVAKNINAQAVIPELADESDDDDVINGVENDVVETRSAPISSDDTKDDKEISAAVAAIETDDKINNDLDGDGVPDDEEVSTKKKPRAKIKVPSIDSLRKKILIGGGLAIALVAFLVWALVIAPTATITIKAKTTPIDINSTLSLIPSSDVDTKNKVLPPVVKQKKVSESVQFDATGSKEIGEKAHGTVAFCYAATRFDPESGKRNVMSIPAGTRLYANGVQFTTDSQIDVKGEGTRCKDDGYYSVKVTAVNIGEEGNISGDTAIQVSGFDVTAIAKGSFSGGSKETIKVVQQSDIDSAIAKIKEKINGDTIKDELQKQMADSTTVISNSFTATNGDAKISPAPGVKVDGKATATMEYTYTLVGVNSDSLKTILEAEIADKYNKSEQKIYSVGQKQLTFKDFKSTDNGFVVGIQGKAHVGPLIDEAALKKNATGKKSEVIKEEISKLPGVSDVQVQMSPFWVSSAPSTNKIKINFTIDE